MYIKHKNHLYGFTLTELLVGLTIGIVVLTGLMSFYFRSSKMIGEQQAIVKNLSQMQFVMNKIVEDIKSANTEAPGSGTSSVSQTLWNNLPYSGYGKVYNINMDPYQGISNYPKDSPTYPVAYNFPYQGDDNGSSTTSLSWFPKQDPLTIPSDSTIPIQSNSLMFYKVIDDKITRIIYYTELDTFNTYKLKKRIQYFPTSIGKRYDDSDPNTSDSLVLSDIKFVQFTYPILSKKLSSSGDVEYDSSQVDNTLKNNIISVNSEPDANKRPFLRSVLMNNYRNTIKIRVATAGPQVGNKRVTAFELSTEVTIRN